MNKNEYSILAADTIRTKAYLQLLDKYGIKPNKIILLEGKDSSNISIKNSSLEYDNQWSSKYWGEIFDYHIPLEETIIKIGAECIRCKNDINDHSVINLIQTLKDDLLLYSGYGGVILKSELFKYKKSFLHIHGGFLPDYRGSTTNYYSLLKQNLFATSGIFLNINIDCGPLISSKKFIVPENKKSIDFYYDPLSRAIHLIEILMAHKNNKLLASNQSEEIYPPYYVIHPVLKHIAILSK